MQVEVYADIVFIVNLIMDFFILWIVSKVSKKNAKMLRLIMGAFVMSIMYVAILFIPILYFHYNFFYSIIIVFGGIYTAFWPKKIKELIKYIVFIHISAFAVGGMGIALFYFTGLPHALGNFVQVKMTNPTIKILLSSICGFYVLIKIFILWIDDILIKKRIIVPIEINIGAQKIMVNGLVDTGNTLKDPTTGESVIIIEFNEIKEALPEKLRLLFYEKKENNLEKLVLSVENDIFKSRIKYIPYKSIGSENGLLVGITCDKIKITNNKEITIKENMVIGIYNINLTSKGDYKALLSPCLLNKG